MIMGNVLDRHGTVLHRPLSASAIVTAARADLRRAEQKRLSRLNRFAPYCFHRDHVRRASFAADLIALALKDRSRGEASTKRETRLLYRDAATLQAALALLRGFTPRAGDTP